MEDTLWTALTDQHIQLPMAITAENLAEQYGLSKEDCDEFAVRSQNLASQAAEEGKFNNEIVGVEIKTRKGMITLDQDEGPRPGTTIDVLAKLPALFKKGGTVSAGNASGITDGAGALIMADEEAVQEYGLKPLARVVSSHFCGVDPKIMGIGPVPAIQGALAKANLTLDDMDMIEVNEAFAAQALSVAKELNIDMDKFNMDGGAIAIGHPLAASGSRIMTHLTHQLHERDLKYAVGSACIGGGQGIAVIIEKVE
eukprot:TRINITY_DN5054_c1_g4_i2.p1 TRINITY_DN5054_c1_g4~~TRINITY_DN5054_c1_g4_i2.p1  ORF type:complete len:255 (-),score=102.66 TRINITY_DN5054_c1_g4_i2:66-830(-)